MLNFSCLSSHVFILQCNMEYISQLLSRYAVNTTLSEHVFCFRTNLQSESYLCFSDSKKESHLLKGLVRANQYEKHLKAED